jgi:hypothetical protein
MTSLEGFRHHHCAILLLFVIVYTGHFNCT